jgi:solute carrier family 45 protein 1/2/4
MTGGFSVSLGDTEPGLNNRSRWAGVASVKGPSWAKLPLVTVGSLGMQILWSVEMGYGEHE